MQLIFIFCLLLTTSLLETKGNNYTGEYNLKSCDMNKCCCPPSKLTIEKSNQSNTYIIKELKTNGTNCTATPGTYNNIAINGDTPSSDITGNFTLSASGLQADLSQNTDKTCIVSMIRVTNAATVNDVMLSIKFLFILTTTIIIFPM